MTVRSGTLWRTAYELDFTGQPNQNIKTGGAGAKVIDGKSWTWDNDGNVATADIVNGTGLVIVANATATAYYPSANVRNAATLTLPVSTAFANFTITQNAIRVLTRMTLTGADANTEGGVLFFEYVTSPRDQNFFLLKAFSGGALVFQADSDIDPAVGAPAINYETVSGPSATSSTDDVLGVTFIPPRACQFWSGAYVSGERMRVSTPRGSVYQNVGIASMRHGSDVRFGVCQVTNNVAGALTTTFTHLRVDFCDFLPAI